MGTDLVQTCAGCCTSFPLSDQPEIRSFCLPTRFFLRVFDLLFANLLNIFSRMSLFQRQVGEEEQEKSHAGVEVRTQDSAYRYLTCLDSGFQPGVITLGCSRVVGNGVAKALLKTLLKLC